MEEAPDETLEAPHASLPMVAVAEIIDKIVERGGQILSDKELQRQVIHNAWEVTKEVTCSRLQMCFVPHDEEQNTWLLDEEPPPPMKDVWGRKQIEVFKETPKVLEEERKIDPRHVRRRKTRAKIYAPVRLANRRQSTMLLRNTRVLPLSNTPVDDRDPDDPLRHEWLQRYAQRLAQAEAIARWEEEELRREEQNRQQEMKVFKREIGELGSSEGLGHAPENAIPPDEMERLPKMNASIQFDVKSCKVTPRDVTEAAKTSFISIQDTSKADSHATEASGPLVPEKGLRSDGFIRSECIQPSPLQTMRVQPGVVLECQGRKKAGPRVPHDPAHPAWKVYKGLAPQEIPIPSARELELDIPELESSLGLDSEAKDLIVDGPHSYRREEPSDWRSRLPSRPASAHAILGTPASALNTAFGLLDQGRTGVTSSKVQGLLAPPSQKDSVLPRRSDRAGGTNSASVLGALRSQPRNPRQKVALLGGHCANSGAVVQPPLGATMGHGLLPSSEANLREAAKKGEFYYPATPSRAQAERPPRASSASLSRTRSHVLERPKSTKTAWR